MKREPTFEIGGVEYSPGEIVCLMSAEERRKVTGLLENPPELFVVFYDEESLICGLTPISFRAAEMLAPERLRIIGIQLEIARGRKRPLVQVVKDEDRAALKEPRNVPFTGV